MNNTAANRPAYVLALLFFLQAWFFGWFVTPLGDIPDESGHYAYVADLSKGRPLPVLGQFENGRGTIPNSLWRDWGTGEGQRINYIVQHPPLYYAVAALPYTVAKKLTDDRVIWAKATRLVSAASLGLLILVCYQILLTLRLDERLALVVASLFGFVPTVTHLSSGITNDIFLTLMCALASLQLVRYLQDQKMPAAYWCAFWLACAGATKMTAWVLIAGFVGIMLFEMRQRPLKWLAHAILISLVSFSSAFWWMRRNIYFHGNPFFVSGSDAAPKAPNYTLLNYLEQQPFFDWLFQHFYALIGFSGYCNSASSLDVLIRYCKGTHLTVVHGASMQIFAYICIALATMLLVALLRHLFGKAKNDAAVDPKTPSETSSVQSLLARYLRLLAVQRWLPAMLALTAILASVYVFTHGFKLDPRYSTKVYILTGLMVSVALIGLGTLAGRYSVETRLLAYGPILLALFTLMLFLKGHEAYVISERAAGIQGRYLFPFIPLVLAAVGLSIKSWRAALPIALTLATLLAWAHLNAYVNTLIPFFNMVRL